MKNVFIWAAMLSLLTVSCGSEKAGNSVDVEDAAEAGLSRAKRNNMACRLPPGIGYLVYADADHQTRVDCVRRRAANGNPAACVLQTQVAFFDRRNERNAVCFFRAD